MSASPGAHLCLTLVENESWEHSMLCFSTSASPPTLPCMLVLLKVLMGLVPDKADATACMRALVAELRCRPAYHACHSLTCLPVPCHAVGLTATQLKRICQPRYVSKALRWLPKEVQDSADHGLATSLTSLGMHMQFRSWPC